MTLQPNTTPALALNLDLWKTLTEGASSATVARHLGLNQPMVWRISTGEQSPSGAFVAAVLLAFPKVDIRKLFIATKDIAA